MQGSFLKGSGLMSLLVVGTFCASLVHAAAIENEIQQGTTVVPTPVPEHGEVLATGELDPGQTITYRVQMLEHGLKVRLDATEGSVGGFYLYDGIGDPVIIAPGQDITINPKPATSEPPTQTPTVGTSAPATSPSEATSPSQATSPSEATNPSEATTPSDPAIIVLNQNGLRLNQVYTTDEVHITVTGAGTGKSKFSIKISDPHTPSSATTLFVSATNIMLLVFAKYFFVS